MTGTYSRIRIVFPFLFVFLFSCSSSRDFELIPNDARVVVALDFKNLALNALSLDNLFSSSDSSVDKTQENNKFDKTGIDFLRQGIAFQRASVQGSERIYVVVPISDKDEFFEFIKSQDSTAEKSKSYEIEWISTREMLFGFKEKTAVGVLDKYMSEDSKTKNYLKEILELKQEDQLVKSNPRFKEMIEKSYDAGVWMDIGKLMESAAIPATSMAIKPSGEITGLLNFDDGKIVLEGDMYNSNPESLKYARMFEKPIETSFLEKIPSAKPMALIGARLDIPILQKALTSFEQSKVFLDGLKNFGIEPNDLFAMLEGHLSISALGAPATGELIPKISLQLAVKDKNKGEAILRTLAAKGILVETGPGIFAAPQMAGVEARLNENLLEITNLPAGGKEFFSPKNVKDFPSGSSIMYMNFKEVANAVPSGVNGRKEIDTFTNYWDSFIMSSTFETESHSKFEIKVNTSKPDQNSFMTILDYYKETKSKDVPAPDPMDPMQDPSALNDIQMEDINAPVMKEE